MRSRLDLLRHALCLCVPQRRIHAKQNDIDRGDHATVAPRNMGRGLHKHEWLCLHPVEKWTTLVDLGRRAPFLLEMPAPSTTTAACSTTGRERGSGKDRGGGWRSKVKTLAAGLLFWRFSKVNAGAKACNSAVVRLSPVALEQHRCLVHELPYCVRLRLCLSFLMWIRSLRDIQDTLARLRLPYADTRRVQRSVIADVFPTRMAERFVDPYTTVSVKMDADLNATAEQVPAPHAWRPEGVEEEERELRQSVLGSGSGNGNGRHGGRPHGGRRSAQSPKHLLRSVQDLHARPSDDDKLASRAKRRSYRLLQQTPASHLAQATPLSPSVSPSPPTPSSSPSSSSSSKVSWAVKDALRSTTPSPLATDHEEDERYHHNYLRGEGCPLDENGRLTSTPIHIAVPNLADLGTVTRFCVMAHTAVLSSLFVEGRTVCFTTNHPLVLNYITFLFDELIEDGWMSASPCEGDARPYMADWSLSEGVLVVLPPREGKSFSTRELRDAAGLILQCAPCCVLVEAAQSDQPSHYSKALMDVVERQQAKVSTPQTKAFWKVSWIPVSPSTTIRGVNGRTNDAKSEFQSAVNEILRQFYMVTFIYTPSNSMLTPRQAQDWWWNGLPSSVHVVGVNSHAANLLYYFPQAPFLLKKIGNAFRYRAVQRVLLGKNVYGGREDCVRQWAHRWFCWGGLSRTGLHCHLAVEERARLLLGNHCGASDTEAVDALKLERTVDYLANPSKVTWFALMTAKLFRV
ncbi:hypothetical protein DQ04_00121040 [Trypanosoma grayi]|uniref:hypothetical protein n=1 Tax=Trypanosoma grayi TaxID=71804 RepID=UPI0004F42EBB|nr:hypothetical protein DQ04_00121040 [Trypanosoma grayi]KEG15272.1 hypothetical protein DQ04_00121040 [Trypanosoma grayi]